VDEFKETVFWTQHGRSPHKLEAIVRASIELVQAQARQNSNKTKDVGMTCHTCCGAADIWKLLGKAESVFSNCRTSAILTILQGRSHTQQWLANINWTQEGEEERRGEERRGEERRGEREREGRGGEGRRRRKRRRKRRRRREGEGRGRGRERREVGE
jgi:hypothetical protein